MSTCPLCGSREGVNGVAVVFEHPNGQRCEVGPGETININCDVFMTPAGVGGDAIQFRVEVVMQNRDGVLKIVGPMRVCRLEGA